MYLELLKNCLLDNIYGSSHSSSSFWADAGKPATQEQIENGIYWPERAHTMIGIKRLSNIQFCVEKVLKDGIDGDFIETGVWRGGACIFMQGILKYFGQNRKLYVADSFEGLPPPDPRYSADKGDEHHTVKFLAVSQEQVQENFKRYNLLDDNVIFIKGFFEHSLPDSGIEKLAILRLDGDMYSSTIQVLNILYDKVSIGGYIIIDDYGLAGCKAAVDDFRKERDIKTPIEVIDSTGVFWRKE